MGEVIRKVKGGRFVGWYLRFVDVDGKRKQRASGQHTHAEAKRMLIEIEARIARGKLGVPEREPELAMMTIADLSERFLSDKKPPNIPSRNENAADWGKRREKRADDPLSTSVSQTFRYSF